MEQLHFYPKFQAEMVLVAFAETKATRAEGIYKKIEKFKKTSLSVVA